MADDSYRLARAFDVTPIRVGWTLASAPLFLLAGPAAGAIAAGTMVAVLASLRGIEALAIRRGLQEVEGWGFPVAGYRVWLLAGQPTFDVEPAGDVGIDVIESAACAVDRKVVIERRGERVVRFVTPRVVLETHRGGQDVEIADRRLLFELRDRVLAPLHTDVGIVAVRMGGADLAAITVSPKTTGAAFRDQAMAAPPALQQLVHRGGVHGRPHEGRTLRYRDERILMASGAWPTSGWIAAVMVAGTIGAGMVLGAVGALFGGLAATAGGIAASHAHSRRRVDKIIEEVNRAGYPVEGYDDWLLSGQPIFDIELRRAPPRALVLYWLGTQHDHTITWLSDTTIRIETRPWLVGSPNSEIPPFWAGNPVVFRKLQDTLLKHLHDRVGVVAVRMGGYVEPRA